MTYSRDDFFRETNVSRETLKDFEHWQATLLKWNRRINLVSAAALTDFWRRHALDSWQIWPSVPENTERMLDLGSGAGFPGLAMAIKCKAQGRGHVTLVESSGKKANFLKAVIRELGLPANVISERAEDIAARPFDVITARAFAPMPELLTYAQPFWQKSTTGLFLKGQSVQEELTKASEMWDYHVTVTPSRSDSTGQIVKITGLAPKTD